jgi:hypothetical protein
VAVFARFGLGALLACAWALSARSQPLPIGTEFQVNTYTTGFQSDPDVSADADGNFVVIWSSEYQDGDETGVFGQRFDGGGNRLGGEFQLNTYTTLHQYDPAVAADPNGNFLVVWDSVGQDGSGDGVFGRGFDAAGNPQGDDFQVNTYTTGSQGYDLPAVAAGPSGNFVVVWPSQGQDGSGAGIFGRRFGPTGPLSGEFAVNSYTTGDQEYPAVATDADGNFVVVWQSRDQDGSSYGVFGQRFDDAGNLLVEEFQVNIHTTGPQEAPAVAASPSGNFVVVWQSEAGVSGQRFDAAGNRLGDEFVVSAGYQGSPAVAADGSGRFIVVWEGESDVFGQHFDAAGNRLGDEFQVNTHTDDYSDDPSVAAAAGGDFVVVWGRASDVFGQRFLPEPWVELQLAFGLLALLRLRRRYIKRLGQGSA